MSLAAAQLVKLQPLPFNSTHQRAITSRVYFCAVLSLRYLEIAQRRQQVHKPLRAACCYAL